MYYGIMICSHRVCNTFHYYIANFVLDYRFQRVYNVFSENSTHMTLCLSHILSGKA